MPNARILIVEDEAMLARNLCRQLEEAGYEVADRIASGEEAVLRAQETKPDLILMDIQLERSYRRDRSGNPHKVHGRYCDRLSPTAHSEADLFQRAKTAEPHAYLTKPASRQELLRTVDMALYKHRMERMLRAARTACPRGWGASVTAFLY